MEIINRKPILLLVGLIFTALIFYSFALNNSFVHDDVAFIVNNPDIKNLEPDSIFKIFFDSPEREGIVNIYHRPLLELIYRVQHLFFGFKPFGYHLVNIFIHAFNAWLVFFLVRLITTKKSYLPVLTSLLFLVHPIQTESVAYFSGISDLIFSFCSLLSLVSYIQSKKSGSAFWLINSLLFFTIGLTAKEHTVIVILLVILYEVIFSQSLLPIKQRAKKLIGFFVVLITYFIYRKLVLGSDGGIHLGSGPELFLRIASIPKTILIYLKLVFWPSGLHFYRNHDILEPYVLWLVLFVIVIITVIVSLKWLTEERKKRAIFGLGLFSLSLLPTLNIIPLILEYSYIFTAEHFLYFPLIGLLIYLLIIGEQIVESKKISRNYAILLIPLFFTLGFITLSHTKTYKNEVTLFERTRLYQPQLSRVHFLLSKAYQKERRFADAARSNAKAIEILKGYVEITPSKEASAHYLERIRVNKAEMDVNCRYSGTNPPIECKLVFDK